MWWDIVKTDLREQFDHDQQTFAVVGGKSIADIVIADYTNFDTQTKEDYHRAMAFLLNKLLKRERLKEDTDTAIEEELRLEARFHSRQLSRMGTEMDARRRTGKTLRGGETFFDIDAENSAGMQSLRPTPAAEYEQRVEWTEEEYNSKTQQEKKNYHEAMSKYNLNPHGRGSPIVPRERETIFGTSVTEQVASGKPRDTVKGNWHNAMAQRMNKDKEYEAPFDETGEDTFVRKPPSHKGKGAVTGGHVDAEGNITDEGREWRRNYMREWRKKKREEGPEFQQKENKKLTDWRHKTGRRVKGRKPWAIKRPKDEEE